MVDSAFIENMLVCINKHPRSINLLVIEDDIKFATYLTNGLVHSGFGVDLAFDKIKGLELVRLIRYDLIVMNIRSPGLEVFELLAEISNRSQTPVLVLGEQKDIDDCMFGLQPGTEICLVKPFNIDQLVRKIQGSLQAHGHQRLYHLNIADLHIDLKSRTASRAGLPIILNSTQFALLALLMQRQGKVLTRQIISSLVWHIPYDKIKSNVVEATISHLRNKIENNRSTKLLHTVWGEGYMLEVRGKRSAE